MNEVNVQPGQRWRSPDGTHFMIDSVDPHANTAVTTVLSNVGVAAGAEALSKFATYTLLREFRVVATGDLGADRRDLAKRFGRDLMRLGFEPIEGGLTAACEVEVWAGSPAEAESLVGAQLPNAEIVSVAAG